jgi:hemoglobin
MSNLELYNRLGGEAVMDVVVERFYYVIMVDNRINHMFTSINVKNQITMLKRFLNHILGGRSYNGRNMRNAHKNLKLADEHFDAMVEDLIKAMNEVGIFEEDIQQVLTVVETTRKDVLNR